MPEQAAAVSAREVGEVLTQAVEQQCEGSRASEGCDAAQEFPFDGDSCQPGQGTAVSVVQERGIEVGEKYTMVQKRGTGVGKVLTQAVEQQCEGSRASEGRDAAQEKAQQEVDAARSTACAESASQNRGLLSQVTAVMRQQSVRGPRCKTGESSRSRQQREKEWCEYMMDSRFAGSLGRWERSLKIAREKQEASEE